MFGRMDSQLDEIAAGASNRWHVLFIMAEWWFTDVNLKSHQTKKCALFWHCGFLSPKYLAVEKRWHYICCPRATEFILSSLSVSFTATSSDDWVPSCSIKVVCIIHHSLSTENPSRTFMSRILRGLKCVIAQVLRFWIWRIASWPYHCLYLTCQWSQHQKGNLLFQMGWVGCWAGLTLLVSTLGPEDLIQWYT